MSSVIFSFHFHQPIAANFSVVAFSGTETISQCYEYALELVCDNVNFDATDVLYKTCQLHIVDGEGNSRYVNGILRHIEEVSFVHDKVYYKAMLVPRVWQLSLVETNEVYLDDTTQDTAVEVLKELGFVEQTDFRFELQLKSYKKWPFRLQYKENHWGFITRILQRDGIFFYFEQTEEHEVLVITDDVNKCQQLPEAAEYTAPGALDTDTHNTINQLVCRTEQTPTTIVLRDFNDETPEVDIRYETEVFPDRTIPATGHTINVYGANIDDTEECQFLADKYAQAHRCRYQSYTGSSGIVSLQAGVRFKVSGHPRKAIKEKTFVLESLSLEGNNPALLEGAIDTARIDVAFSNSFVAYATDHGYAPFPPQHKPEIKGNLQATIDAAGDGQYAELDEQGRYKVRFPFDRRDRDGGKSSYWLRMMQPYGGKGEGMHFPLRKSTRVLVAFLGGDPDRPYIAGTIGDATQKSVVSAENQTNNVIQSAAGNRIEIEDKDGSNRIKLESPTASTYMHLGAPNHSGQGYVMYTNGIQAETVLGGRNVYYKADVTSSADDAQGSGLGTGAALQDATNTLYARTNYFSFPDTTNELEGAYIIERYDGDMRVHHGGGDKRTYREYKFSDTEATGDKNKYFHYGIGWDVFFKEHNGNVESETAAGLIKTMLDFKLKGVELHSSNGNDDDQSAYRTAGSGTEKIKYQIPNVGTVDANNKDEMKWKAHLNQGHVRVADHDTFNIQNGNIYDFGGYWNYNLGNSYAENYLNQSNVVVNKKHDRDLLNRGGPHWTSLSLPSNIKPACFGASISDSFNLNEAAEGEYWVEKTFDGNEYNYSKNIKSIDVSNGCNSLDISYGGTSWEVKYNGDGDKVAVEKSGGGISESWSSTHDGKFAEYSKTDKSKDANGIVNETRHYARGNPVSFEIERKPDPGTSFSFRGDGLPKLDMSLSTDMGKTSFSTEMSMGSNEVSLVGTPFKNSVELGYCLMENSIKQTFTAITNEVVFNGASLEKIESNLPQLKAKAKLRMLEIETDKALKLNDEMLEIKKTNLALFDKIMTLETIKLAINNNILSMNG